MNNFEKSEYIGRSKFIRLLKQLGITRYQPTKQTDRIDIYFAKENKVCAAEIKDRALKYELYDTYIIELSKLQYMKQLIDSKKVDQCFYCLIFGDSFYIYTYTQIIKMINNKEIELQERYMPKTTAEKGEFVPKQIFEIPRNKAKQYKLK